MLKITILNVMNDLIITMKLSKIVPSILCSVDFKVVFYGRNVLTICQNLRSGYLWLMWEILRLLWNFPHSCKIFLIFNMNSCKNLLAFFLFPRAPSQGQKHNIFLYLYIIPIPFIAFLRILASSSAENGLAGTMVGLDLSTMLACKFILAIPVVAMPTLGPPGTCKYFYI